MKKAPYLVLLFLSTFFIGCDREPTVTIIENEQTDFNFIATTTTLSIKATTGTIAIDGASVSVGNRTTKTDENGFAIIPNAQRTLLGFTITVSKADYQTEVLFIPFSSESQIDFIHRNALLEGEINIQPVEDVSEFSGAFLGENFHLDIPADAFLDSQGNIFKDNYSLEGFMRSVDGQDDELVYPQIYINGVVGPMLISKYEFQILAKSIDGEMLSLAPGKSIGLEYSESSIINIEPGLSPNYSSAIIDPITGTAQIGTLFTNEDSKITGSVVALGKGYLGFSRSTIEVKCKLLSSNQTILKYMPVKVTLDNNSNYVTSTDGQGNLIIVAPENVDINVSINLCGVETSKLLGNFNEDVDLNLINLDLSGTNIIGNVQECDMESEILGYLIVDGQAFGNIAADGTISGTWICNDESFGGFKVYNSLTGHSKEVTQEIEIIGNDVDLGNIIIGCTGGGIGLCGTVKFDADDDGIAESISELSNYTTGIVRLYEGAGGLIAETELSAGGTYCFEQIMQNLTYEVELQLVDAVTFEDLVFYDITNTVNVRDDNKKVFQRVGSNQFQADFHFIDKQRGSVSGTVLVDSDGDGVGDTPFSGRSVTLLLDQNNDGVANSQYEIVSTDINGNYTFSDVPNGGAIIRLEDVDNPSVTVLSEGDITPEDGIDIVTTDTDGYIRVYVKRSESDNDNNFTVRYETIVPSNASIAGSVLVDTDGDDIGDAAYAGEILLLYQRGENNLPISNSTFEERNTISEFDGSYSFSNVPTGKYVIQSTGLFVDGVGTIASFTRISDKDESPESGEPLDEADPNGFIIVDVVAGQTDTDNNVIIRF